MNDFVGVTPQRDHSTLYYDMRAEMPIFIKCLVRVDAAWNRMPDHFPDSKEVSVVVRRT